MTISIVCPNGHKLRVKDELAGRKVKCPNCGSAIVIPAVHSAPESDSPQNSVPAGDFDLSAYIPAPNPAAIPSRPVQGAPQRTPASRKSSNEPQMRAPARKQSLAEIDRLMALYWFLGGNAGGAVLGGLILLVVWLSSAGTNVPPSSVKSLNTAPPNSTNVAATEASVAPTTTAPSIAPTNTPSVAQSIPSKVAPISTDAESVNEISNKLKRIGIAFHNFHDINRIFAYVSERDIEVVDPNRNPRATSLSWRVHLLPYLDQKPLYDSFHLDEPWDSAHNRRLLDKMPEAYRIDSTDVNTTRFQVITGPNALFGSPKPPRLSDVMDGIPHTILAIVVGSDRAVPWTKPDELTLDPNDPIASLGTLPDRLIKCVMTDANPLIVVNDIEPANFLGLSTPNGKEILDAETFRRKFKERTASNLAKQPSKTAPTANSSAANTTGGQFAPSGSPTDLRMVMDGRMNKLKEIVVATIDYESSRRQLPIWDYPANFDAKGKPFLSWRVHLLPYLNQQLLYSQFKMEEPWDSPHNKALIDKMPEVYRDATDKSDSFKTRMVTITGPETLYPTSYKGPKNHQITDGSYATLLIAFCGLDKAVTWTQPEDVTFDPKNPLACLGQLDEPAIFYARVDGAVKVLQPTIPPDLFKAIVTPKGGEILPDNFDSFLIR